MRLHRHPFVEMGPPEASNAHPLLISRGLAAEMARPWRLPLIHMVAVGNLPVVSAVEHLAQYLRTHSVRLVTV